MINIFFKCNKGILIQGTSSHLAEVAPSEHGDEPEVVEAHAAIGLCVAVPQAPGDAGAGGDGGCLLHHAVRLHRHKGRKLMLCGDFILQRNSYNEFHDIETLKRLVFFLLI